MTAQAPDSTHHKNQLELATLGGGCFWCLEAVFEQLAGVAAVESGYSGGTVVDPSYRQVTQGTTGHAEVVQITYDPRQIAYKDILEVFFTIHDPTTLNRQGADVGPQYRSVIFYHDPEQRSTAEDVLRAFDAKGIWERPIVTELQPFHRFYRAEDYHQGYFRKNPYQGYCQVVIAPKVAKFRREFLTKLKEPA
jgi:peptide-methionine (S)-S-oxide reductase